MSADAGTDPDQRVGAGVTALILAGGPAVAMALSGVSVALPRMEAALAHTSEDKYLVKMMVGLVGAACVLGAPLTGFLADRLGLRRVVFLNYLLFALAGSSGLYLNDLRALVGARFILGVAGAGAVTASIIIINRRVAPQLRAQWMGAYIAASYAVALVLQPIAGFLAERSWHATFVIYLAGAPLAAVALMSLRREAAARPGARSEKASDAEPLLRWFPFGMAGFALLMGCVTYLPLIYTPFLLRQLGAGPQLTGLALLGDTLSGTVTALLFGLASRRLSADVRFALAFTAAGAGALIVGLATDYVGVFAGLAFIGLGGGWFMPNLMFLLGQRLKPHQQGRGAGLVKGANYLATPVSVMAAEGLAQAHGPRVALFMAAGVSGLLLAFILLRGLRRRRVGSAQA